MDEKRIREALKDKQRIVLKIGSSSIIHEETGGADYRKLETLVRIICDLKNQGKDVILVSSGAIGVGFEMLGLRHKPKTVSLKQACAAIGQGQLMMIYQKLFMEYNHMAAQVLLTFDAITDPERRRNAENTLNELLQQGVIPVVNENDTVATEEIEFGDNDTMSAIVAHLIKADLLILLTDIDGFYTDDPHKNPEAKKLTLVETIDDTMKNMAKDAVTNYGTGGMSTKIAAARIATDSGADMAIMDAENLTQIYDLMEGKSVGTLFLAHENDDLIRLISSCIKDTRNKNRNGEYRMNEADIQRINELARKSKTVEGLTEAELAEQAALRKAYIASVKRNLKTQLDNIDIKEADGSITHVKDIPKNKRSEYIQIRLK